MAAMKIILTQLYPLPRQEPSLCDVDQVLPTLHKASGCQHTQPPPVEPDMSLHVSASVAHPSHCLPTALHAPLLPVCTYVWQAAT